MSDAKTTLLNQLQGIQLPEPPVQTSLGFPLLALLMTAIGFMVLAYYGYRHIGSRKQHILQRVAAIAQLPSQSIEYELARLLRQIVLQHTGPSVNSLEGEPWLQQLDTHFNTHYFTQGNGQRFALAIYQKNDMSSVEAQQLCDQIAQLIKHTVPTENARNVT